MLNTFPAWCFSEDTLAVQVRSCLRHGRQDSPQENPAGAHLLALSLYHNINTCMGTSPTCLNSLQMNTAQQPFPFITPFLAPAMQIRTNTYQQRTLHAVRVMLFDFKPDVRHAEVKCK